jgi:predicted negative regulator of RcsB-dependent stress response
VEDLSDIERAEQVRTFVRENLWFALLALALGVAAVTGFRYWQAKRTGGAEQAESEYSAVITALSSGQREQAGELAKELRAKHAGSPYADQADLAIAKLAVVRRDYDDAAKVLRSVMDNANDPLLRQVARTRLARVLIEQGKHDDAIALLPLADAGAFQALYHDIRGDAYAAKGDAATARTEYTAALEKDSANSGLDSAYVALKRDAIPAASTKPAPAAASAEPAPTAGSTAPAPTAATAPAEIPSKSAQDKQP